MRIYSLIWCDHDPHPSGDVIILNRHKVGVLAIVRAIFSARPGDAFILNGALGLREYLFDLWIAAIIALFRKGITIVISDATWHPRAEGDRSKTKQFHRLYAWFQRKLLLAAESPWTFYCFLSKAEVDLFRRETGIHADRVIFTKFCTQLPPNLNAIAPSSQDEKEDVVVFSGGNSSRDYETLIEAARGCDKRFLIASSNIYSDLPDNVTVKWLDQQEYYAALSRSSIVVVPLVAHPRRSAGQQTYLSAMALGKLTIVSDVMGVNDHLRPGIDALVVPAHDAQALRNAILWALAEKNGESVEAIRKSGMDLCGSLTFVDYFHRLQAIARWAPKSHLAYSSPARE
ncbi:glycosyltransferase [Thiomonas bhubaneswarensis]|nr:glycosyltransferase [Thiomonas bhubaneswarensis]